MHTSAEIHIGVAVKALTDYLVGVAYHTCVIFAHAYFLLARDYIRSALSFALVYLVGHFGGGSILFRRIGKAAKTLKLYIVYKFGKFAELLLRFTGEARDKRCSQHHTGNFTAELCKQFTQALLVAATVHIAENFLVAVLYRNVNIIQHLVLCLYCFDKLVRHSFGIAVKQSYPLYAVYLTQLLKQIRQSVFLIKVNSVCRNVLCYYNKFLYAVFGKFLCFLYYILHLSGTHFTSYKRYCAVRTFV